MFWVRIDKNRKLPITCLIRALGLKTDAEILDRFGDDPRIVATLEKDTCKTYEEAMLEIYRKLRPGEPPTLDSAETLIQNLFFDPRRYDLSTVGRYKFNKKLTLWARVKRSEAGHARGRPRHRRDPLRRGPRPDPRDDCREMDAIGVGEVSVNARKRRRDPRVYQPACATCATMWTLTRARSAASRSACASSVLQDLLSQYEGEELIEQSVSSTPTSWCPSTSSSTISSPPSTI